MSTQFPKEVVLPSINTSKATHINNLNTIKANTALIDLRLEDYLANDYLKVLPNTTITFLTTDLSSNKEQKYDYIFFNADIEYFIDYTDIGNGIRYNSPPLNKVLDLLNPNGIIELESNNKLEIPNFNIEQVIHYKEKRSETYITRFTKQPVKEVVLMELPTT